MASTPPLSSRLLATAPAGRCPCCGVLALSLAAPPALVGGFVGDGGHCGVGGGVREWGGVGVGLGLGGGEGQVGDACLVVRVGWQREDEGFACRTEKCATRPKG